MTVFSVLIYFTSLGEHVFFQVISEQIFYSALLWCWLQISTITNSTMYPLTEPFLMHVSFCVASYYFMQFQENCPFCLCFRSTFCYGHVFHHVTSKQIVPSLMWKGSLSVALDTLYLCLCKSVCLKMWWSGSPLNCCAQPHLMFTRRVKLVPLQVFLHSSNGIWRLMWTNMRTFLRWFRAVPQLYICRSACCSNALHMQVCQTVGEADLYPCLDQRVQRLEPRDVAQCMDFCHILVPGIA